MTSAAQPPVWRRRTPRQSLLIWLGWLALVALTVFCWQVTTRDTIWLFVLDAPAQAADIGSRRHGNSLQYPTMLVPAEGLEPPTL